LLFDGAEEMDFAGPWEVFTAAVDRLTGERVMTVAQTLRPVVCEWECVFSPTRRSARRLISPVKLF